VGNSNEPQPQMHNYEGISDEEARVQIAFTSRKLRGWRERAARRYSVQALAIGLKHRAHGRCFSGGRNCLPARNHSNSPPPGTFKHGMPCLSRPTYRLTNASLRRLAHITVQIVKCRYLLPYVDELETNTRSLPQWCGMQTRDCT
jgi:hypothetical protein